MRRLAEAVTLTAVGLSIAALILAAIAADIVTTFLIVGATAVSFLLYVAVTP